VSEIKIRRRSRTFDVVLSTATDAATTLRLEDFAGACIDTGTLHTAVTTLTIYGGSSESGPWRPLYDDAGSAVEMTLAPSTTEGRVYNFPDAVFALQHAKLVANDSNGEGVPATVTIKS